MAKELIKSEIEFDVKNKLKRKKNLLKELDDLDDESSLPSNLFVKKEKEPKKEKKEKAKKEAINFTDFSLSDSSEESDNSDDWSATLSTFSAPKIRKTKNFFKGINPEKKKGKKKDKKGEIVNHKKEFEPEMALLKSLQVDQQKFVNSLQRKYDQMENTKSSARGVSKYATDLALNINSARDLQLRLVDKLVNIKKTVADLDFKERKEFGAKSNSEQQNMNNYASTFLKTIIDKGRESVLGEDPMEIDDLGDDDDSGDSMIDSIDESLGKSNRSEDVEKSLKYEKNGGIDVRIRYYDSKDVDDIRDKYDFVVYDKDGNDVTYDFPNLKKTALHINKTTQVATDEYGVKYNMEIVS